MIECRLTPRASFEVVPAPDSAYAGVTDADVLRPQPVGDPVRAVGRVLERAGQDRRLDVGRSPIRVRVLPPAVLVDQGSGTADRKGPPHLEERVAVVAQDLAGLRDVSELLGELQR